MYVAKKDFKYKTNEWKKGEDVKASTSLIATFIANGYIEVKKAESQKQKQKEK